LTLLIENAVQVTRAKEKNSRKIIKSVVIAVPDLMGQTEGRTALSRTCALASPSTRLVMDSSLHRVDVEISESSIPRGKAVQFYEYILPTSTEMKRLRSPHTSLPTRTKHSKSYIQSTCARLRENAEKKLEDE